MCFVLWAKWVLLISVCLEASLAYLHIWIDQIYGVYRVTVFQIYVLGSESASLWPNSCYRWTLKSNSIVKYAMWLSKSWAKELRFADCASLLRLFIFWWIKANIRKFLFVQDKVPIVRTQAVLAIYRLQDGSDKNCPITKSKKACLQFRIFKLMSI